MALWVNWLRKRANCIQSLIVFGRRFRRYNRIWELSAIVETLKNWCHYLNSCQHEVLIDQKTTSVHGYKELELPSGPLGLGAVPHQLSPKQANWAVDALLRYPQRSQGKEEIFQAEKTRIFQRLQSLLISASSRLVFVCETEASGTASGRSERKQRNPPPRNQSRASKAVRHTVPRQKFPLDPAVSRFLRFHPTSSLSSTSSFYYVTYFIRYHFWQSAS